MGKKTPAKDKGYEEVDGEFHVNKGNVLAKCCRNLLAQMKETLDSQEQELKELKQKLKNARKLGLNKIEFCQLRKQIQGLEQTLADNEHYRDLGNKALFEKETGKKVRHYRHCDFCNK